MLAAAAVVVGAPVFANGVHALRLRRQLGDVRPVGFADAEDGQYAQLSGAVALESPLFGPLSGAPCAGYDLDVVGIGAPVQHAIAERRPFRLDGEDGSAQIAPAPGPWEIGETARREIGADEGITAGLAALLARAPEALWWRRAGGRLLLVERALRAGSVAHVVGRVRAVRSFAAQADVVLRTGTDDAAVTTEVASPGVELSVGVADPLDWMLVSDRAPDPARFAVPLARAAGAVIGPLLSLSGMLYLASAAEHVRRLGRF